MKKELFYDERTQKESKNKIIQEIYDKKMNVLENIKNKEINIKNYEKKRLIN